MKTIILSVDEKKDNSESYAQAVDFLENGEVVAFPTETVYGLGAIATNDMAVKKIFAAKNRPADNPLIVHVGTVEEISAYVEEIPDVAKKCMDAFWPGPLTLILPAKKGLFSPNVTAGLSTVGIRMPDHPVALKLLQQLKQPVAAPSANRSGKPSPTKAEHVLEDLQGSISCVIDGGRTGLGLESTVLDVTLDIPTILRPGGVTKEMLEAIIGAVNAPNQEEQKDDATPKAPGMKYTHYAPNAPVYLIEPNAMKIDKALSELQGRGEKIALIAPTYLANQAAHYHFSVGEQDNLEMHSACLYDALRACDKTDATVILSTTTTTDGVGAAIMNRLEKASLGYWEK